MLISLPDELQVAIEKKSKANRFKSVEDYIVHLVLSDEEISDDEDAPIPECLIPLDRADLEKKLIQGLESGSPIRVTPEFWADLRHQVERAKHKES